MSRSVPVNVIAGCMARTRAPRWAAGARMARPCLPEVCTTYWPSRITPLAASMVTTLPSMSSGTVSRSRSQDLATAVGLSTRTPGNRVSIRVRLAGDSPATATISCPASRRTAASTAPTRPAPTTPMRVMVIAFRSSPSRVPDGVQMRYQTRSKILAEVPQRVVSWITGLRARRWPAPSRASVPWARVQPHLARHATGAAADVGPAVEGGLGRRPLRPRGLLPARVSGGPLPNVGARVATLRAGARAAGPRSRIGHTRGHRRRAWRAVAGGARGRPGSPPAGGRGGPPPSRPAGCHRLDDGAPRVCRGPRRRERVARQHPLSRRRDGAGRSAAHRPRRCRNGRRVPGAPARPHLGATDFEHLGGAVVAPGPPRARHACRGRQHTGRGMGRGGGADLSRPGSRRRLRPSGTTRDHPWGRSAPTAPEPRSTCCRTAHATSPPWSPWTP